MLTREKSVRRDVHLSMVEYCEYAKTCLGSNHAERLNPSGQKSYAALWPKAVIDLRNGQFIEPQDGYHEYERTLSVTLRGQS